MAWKGAGAWRDLLAIAARELLAHRLDHLPLTGLRFQRPRHVLAKLAQPVAAAACAGRRRRDHHAFAGKMVGERIAVGTLARKSANVRRLGDGFFRRQFVLRGAGFRLLRTSAPTGRSDAPSAPTVVRKSGAPAWRSAASAARSAQCLRRLWPGPPPVPRRLAARSRAPTPPSGRRFLGKSVAGGVHDDGVNHKSRDSWRPKMRSTQDFFALIRRSSAARSTADFASRSLPAYRPSEPPISKQRRLSLKAR